MYLHVNRACLLFWVLIVCRFSDFMLSSFTDILSFSGRKSAHHGNTEKVIVPSHYSFINSDFFSRAFSLVEKRLARA